MSSGELSSLQLRVLEALADLEPPWTLTGGGALVGFYLHHRTTRDLDLFLHGRATLEDYASRVTDRLRSAGLEVRSLQSGTSMHRLQVAEADESTVLDLVADPVPCIEAPVELPLGRVSIRVDTEHEILVNKLCALVQRSELRDLADVYELLKSGCDLERALADAPAKDGGFSPLTLVWLLRDLPVAAVARAEGWSATRTTRIEQFRDELVRKIGDLAHPAD